MKLFSALFLGIPEKGFRENKVDQICEKSTQVRENMRVMRHAGHSCMLAGYRGIKRTDASSLVEGEATGRTDSVYYEGCDEGG